MKEDSCDTGDNVYDRDEFESRLKNAFWCIRSQGYRNEQEALDLINSGMLGFKKNQSGKKTPITISKRSYYRYKKQFTEIPQIYDDARQMAKIGYIALANGFNAELAELHAEVISIKNNSELKPIQKLHVIEVICKTIIPTRSAFADVVRNLHDDNQASDEEKGNSKEPEHV